MTSVQAIRSEGVLRWLKLMVILCYLKTKAHFAPPTIRNATVHTTTRSFTGTFRKMTVDGDPVLLVQGDGPHCEATIPLSAVEHIENASAEDHDTS